MLSSQVLGKVQNLRSCHTPPCFMPEKCPALLGPWASPGSCECPTSQEAALCATRLGVKGSTKSSERKLVLVHIREEGTPCPWATASHSRQSGVNPFWPGGSCSSSLIAPHPNPELGAQKYSTTGFCKNQCLPSMTGCSSLSRPQFTSYTSGLDNPLPTSQLSPPTVMG